jgi:hypothetical protein
MSIRKVVDEEVEPSPDALVRAFPDDPVVHWLFRDQARRADRLRMLYVEPGALHEGHGTGQPILDTGMSAEQRTYSADGGLPSFVCADPREWMKRHGSEGAQ